MGQTNHPAIVTHNIPRPSDVRRLASGLGFTESPTWTDKGQLFVTSVNRGIVYEVFLDAAVPEFRGEPGGGPNGIVAHGDDLLVCQNGGKAMKSRSTKRPPPSIQRLSMDAHVVQILEVGVTAPSDGVIGPDGHLWFTDPVDHSLGVDARKGAVRSFDLETRVLTTVLADLFFPNGLVFAPDGETLYVAESATRRVRQYKQDRTGCWVRQPWHDIELPGVPDGLSVDVEGYIWVACSFSGQVVRLHPSGAIDTTIDLGPEVPTAVCFAGEELDQLIVTSARGGAVLALPALCPGLRSHPLAAASAPPQHTRQNGSA